MRLDIVEGFNQYFEYKYPHKGHFVSHLSIETNKVVKVLKTYKLELWHIKGKNKELVISITENTKATELIDNIQKTLNIKLTAELFNKLREIENKYGI